MVVVFILATHAVSSSSIANLCIRPGNNQGTYSCAALAKFACSDDDEMSSAKLPVPNVFAAPTVLGTRKLSILLPATIALPDLIICGALGISLVPVGASKALFAPPR